MSNAAYPQPKDELIDDCQFDHFLAELKQQCFLQEQVVTTLREANAAFAAQCTDPNGYAFIMTCEDLTRFLNFKILIEYSEQELLVQVLQVACAMHENAISNPTLTPTQHLLHHLATTRLLPLCRTALEHSITYPDILRDARQVTDRARQAYDKATDALNLAKYHDFDNSEDDPLSVSGKGTDQTSGSSSVTLSPPPPAPKGGSVQDTAAAGACRTPRSAKRKEQVLAMLRDKPYRAAPLGRSHTAPTLLQTTPGSYSSRTSADRTSSKAHPGKHALHALEETEE